jgi:hypothetical protein
MGYHVQIFRNSIQFQIEFRYVYLFVSGLFNNFVSSSDYTEQRRHFDMGALCPKTGVYKQVLHIEYSEI